MIKRKIIYCRTWLIVVRIYLRGNEEEKKKRKKKKRGESGML